MIHVPILVVEDEQDQVEYLKIIARDALVSLGLDRTVECDINVAGDIVEGESGANEGLYPLAIIDLALPDPRAGMYRDISKYPGLDFIAAVRRANKDTVVGIFTAHSAETAPKLISLHVDGLLSKQMAQDELVQSFSALLSTALQRFNYMVDPRTDECLTLAFGVQGPPRGNKQNWETCLRRFLWSAAGDIEYDRVGRGRSGAGIVAAYIADTLPVILKLHTFSDLEDELARYERFVKRYIASRTITSQEELAQSDSVGCLAYSFVGLVQRPTTLADAIAVAPIDQVSAAVEYHFSSNCKRWFGIGGVEKPFDLAPECRRRYNLNSSNILPLSLSSQCENAVRRAAKAVGTSNGTLVETIRSAVESPYRKIHCKPEVTIHGDLNALNLIWDGRALWMIDFAKTGPGPRLLDFAKLEASVKFDVIHRRSGLSDEDLLATILLCEDVLIERFENDAVPSAVPELLGRKIAVVNAVRRQARPHIATDDGMDYWMSLFFLTAKHVQYLIEDISAGAGTYVQLVHALASAFRLAQKLWAVRDGQ